MPPYWTCFSKLSKTPMDNDIKSERAHVLFVDDEEHILNALRRLLVDEDYEVLTARSGPEALEILRHADIAVIVTDQKMPQMTGAEFLEQARSVSPDSGRIVLTGQADVEMAVDAINRGQAHRYISKPWNNDELIAAIRSAADGSRLIRENRRLTSLISRQNKQLKKWSAELELAVQQQTIELTYKNRELAELNTRLEKEFRDFMITISNLIELKDTRIANHSNHVAALSVNIAKKLRLNDKDIQNIAIAAQLHDIGKIGIPDSILLKDIDSLAPFEMHEYRKHPVRGQAAIGFNKGFQDAALLVRHHHESLDGKGFPDGLMKDEIPLGSRIIAISDRFDRLLPTHTPQNALTEIKKHLGPVFDLHLYPFLDEIAHEKLHIISSTVQTVEEVIHPDQLEPGMVISRDVRSGTGVLLVGKGVVLNPRRIDSLKRYYKLDPPDTGVYVSKNS